MTRRPAILAVDGGGSKIDAALLRRDGTLLGAARVRSTNHHGVGLPEHLELVLDVLAAASTDAGLDPERRPIADVGVFCLAGADLPADDRRIAAWLRSRHLAREHLVRNDTFAVLRAGTDRSWGVGVVCGYGTNCAARSPTGRVMRFPAVGTVSGDWGGGADVGGEALWHAIRAEDGRGEATSLRRLVPEHFGLKRPHQLVAAMHLGRLEEDRVVELAPLVFRAASDGDAVARRIVDRQADEIVTMTGAAIRRLKMNKLDVDVVLGGGIFRNRDGAFFERIRRGIREIASGARVEVLRDPPVIGAALIGLDALHATNAAQRRIRAALTHERLGSHTLARRKE
jgi:N-acetylglucosamine kinase-like BadF-type ATPase